MNTLVGKTILQIQLAADREAIRFVTDQGEVIARCDADCCSHTWIEHIELPARGFPALVISAENLNLDKPDSWDGGDCVTFYGFAIRTDKGDMVIDYRNSSNGYYGGSLEWPDSGYFYGGVYGQNISKQEWRDIEP
jgi:hypothetical protein